MDKSLEKIDFNFDDNNYYKNHQGKKSDYDNKKIEEELVKIDREFQKQIKHDRKIMAPIHFLCSMFCVIVALLMINIIHEVFKLYSVGKNFQTNEQNITRSLNLILENFQLLIEKANELTNNSTNLEDFLISSIVSKK